MAFKERGPGSDLGHLESGGGFGRQIVWPVDMPPVLRAVMTGEPHDEIVPRLSTCVVWFRQTVFKGVKSGQAGRDETTGQSGDCVGGGENILP